MPYAVASPSSYRKRCYYSHGDANRYDFTTVRQKKTEWKEWKKKTGPFIYIYMKNIKKRRRRSRRQQTHYPKSRDPQRWQRARVSAGQQKAHATWRFLPLTIYACVRSVIPFFPHRVHVIIIYIPVRAGVYYSDWREILFYYCNSRQSKMFILYFYRISNI